MERSEIIHELAKEYGMEGRPETEMSHYDKGTGTLYVGSKVYSHDDLSRARRFFAENKKKMHSFGDAASEMYEIGVVAVDFLMDQSISSGGRIVIKEQ